MTCSMPLRIYRVDIEAGVTDEVDLDQCVNDQHIEKFSRSFGGKWRSLPPYLEMETIIVDDIDRKPMEEKRYEFFKKWKRVKGPHATYRKIRREEDAESMSKMLKTSITALRKVKINKSSVVEPSTQASESRIGEGGNEVPEHDQYVDQQAPVDPPSGPTSTSTSIVIVDREDDLINSTDVCSPHQGHKILQHFHTKLIEAISSDPQEVANKLLEKELHRLRNRDWKQSVWSQDKT